MITAIKDHPILFSAPMVRAILEGHKTQTRRVVKYQLFESSDDGLDVQVAIGNCTCPYGQPGDLLWVKESYRIDHENPLRDPTTYAIYDYDPPTYMYKADKWPHIQKLMKWKPSIFMPRVASRITLEITNVRIERLQHITPDDCLAEGVGRELIIPHEATFKTITLDAIAYQKDLIDNYHHLWDSINGKSHPWDSNPWVWVIEFRKAI